MAPACVLSFAAHGFALGTWRLRVQAAARAARLSFPDSPSAQPASPVLLALKAPDDLPVSENGPSGRWCSTSQFTAPRTAALAFAPFTSRSASTASAVASVLAPRSARGAPWHDWSGRDLSEVKYCRK